MDRWNDELYHHGVIGMRWGVRKAENRTRRLRASYKSEKQGYEARSKRAKDSANGLVSGVKGALVGAVSAGGAMHKGLNKKAAAAIGVGVGITYGFLDAGLQKLDIRIARKTAPKYESKTNSLLNKYKAAKINSDSKRKALNTYKRQTKSAKKDYFETIKKANKIYKDASKPRGEFEPRKPSKHSMTEFEPKKPPKWGMVENPGKVNRVKTWR